MWGILRAPRGDGKEALLLATPLGLASSNSSRPGVRLLQDICCLLRRSRLYRCADFASWLHEGDKMGGMLPTFTNEHFVPCSAMVAFTLPLAFYILNRVQSCFVSYASWLSHGTSLEWASQPVPRWLLLPSSASHCSVRCGSMQGGEPCIQEVHLNLGRLDQGQQGGLH